MSKTIKSTERWILGISDFLKEGTNVGYFLGQGFNDNYYSLGRNIDHRSDPKSITLNPRTIKESGSVITDLPKWGEIVGTDTYIYGDGGSIYTRTSSGIWSGLRTVAGSHGNGMSYFGEDDFIYYTTDTAIGRYGPITGTPQFNDDFLASQGGVPLNTNALSLVAASSQYAYRADTASLSITGDLSIEAQIHPTSLPTAGDAMVFVSKWNGNGNLRSYKFDITTESNYFGDGSDGSLTISADTTEAPIDSACSGIVGTTNLTATNVSFAAGQIVLIHQSQGTGAGTWQKNKITSYTAGTIQLESTLNATYTTGAQVRVLKQYTDVTVNSGKTYTAKAWNGTVGGILAFLYSGTLSGTGTITASGKGFRGASGVTTAYAGGKQGEGYGSATYDSISTAANYNAGGGGAVANTGSGGIGGGGGGNGSVGSSGVGVGGAASPPGAGGSVSGTSDLTTMTFGGGGGSGSHSYTTGGESTGAGGIGGGIIFIAGVTHSFTGSITSLGLAGSDSAGHANGGGGGGGGGAVLVKSQVATLGTLFITATGGAGGAGGSFGLLGGAGGTGRIHLDYYTSYTGTTSPTINATQDQTLGAADGYVMRLQLSSDGTSITTFSKPFTPIIDLWKHVAVSFDSATTGDASICSCEFFLNGVSIGQSTTTTQTIHDNTSEFFVGSYKNDAGTAASFYNGYIDEVRVWSKVLTADDYSMGINQQILTTIPYLQTYYKFNGDVTDSTANVNHLTASGSPIYVTDVPFPSPTTRLDIDQTATTTGNTYTLPIAISESATNRLTFTPQKDPQKSIAILVAAKGTGDWTLTVHDSFNNVIASKTIVNALIAVGYNEFVFSTPWRPLLNANYHFHLTSTVADGTVTTTTASDLTTVSYKTYFQFLVTDTEWHPVAKMLQLLVFGNERYVGTYEATLYNPNKITLPANYRIRCFAYYKEYLAIGTMKGDSITEQDAGRIYFWDGIATSYNFFIDVPQGGVNAMLGAKGQLYVWAGYQGDLMVYSGGGTQGDSVEQIKRIPLIAQSESVEIYPGAVSMWKMLLRWGVCGDSNSDNIQRNVYTWGSSNNRYHESLSSDYTISTGNYGSSVKIGLVMVVDQKLLIGWQDNVSYGVDYVFPSNEPYLTGMVEQLVEDNGTIWKEKEVLTLVAKFLPLNMGESINLKYKLNRADNWTYLGPVTTAGETTARFVISGGGSRYNEIQYGADLATTSITAPTLQSLVIESDMLATEERVG